MKYRINKKVQWKDETGTYEIYPKDIAEFERLKQNLERKYSGEILDRQMALRTLQSQINPHFLYNTLESIRGQALMEDCRDIAGIVKSLAGYYRYSISSKGTIVSLLEEYNNVCEYFKILQYRFEGKFEMVTDMPEELLLDYYCPKLILQPIVENACMHGLSDCLGNGIVSITVKATDQKLYIVISDNGKGIDQQQVQQLNATLRDVNLQLGPKKNEESKSIALQNVAARIRLLFGNEYGVRIRSARHVGTDVELMIPKVHASDIERYEKEGNYL